MHVTCSCIIIFPSHQQSNGCYKSSESRHLVRTKTCASVAFCLQPLRESLFLAADSCNDDCYWITTKHVKHTLTTTTTTQKTICTIMPCLEEHWRRICAADTLREALQHLCTVISKCVFSPRRRRRRCRIWFTRRFESMMTVANYTSTHHPATQTLCSFSWMRLRFCPRTTDSRCCCQFVLLLVLLLLLLLLPLAAPDA